MIISATKSSIIKAIFSIGFIALSILRFIQFFDSPLNMEAYIPYKFAF